MTSSIYDLFFMDIETVPESQSYNALSANQQKLWADKISKTLPENISCEECYISKAGILAEFGKIICISTAYLYEKENHEPYLKIKSISGDDEKALLREFIMLTDKVYKFNKNFEFAGHNIREFDVPYICRRLLINQLPLPSYLSFHGAKPWEIKMIDSLQLWKFGDYKNFISLDLLAHVLQVPTSKTDINGSMVADVYYNEKNLQRIIDYCERDVIVVANVIMRFKNLPLLKEENIILVK